jgi:hypothetical protein
MKQSVPTSSSVSHRFISLAFTHIYILKNATPRKQFADPLTAFKLVVLRCHPAPAQSFRIYIVACLSMTLITANMKYE